MHAHKMKLNIPPNHRVTFDLPADFPAGEAEVIVLASRLSALPDATTKPLQNDQARVDFSSWLNGLLDRLPPAPELPAEAFDRASIYED